MWDVSAGIYARSFDFILHGRKGQRWRSPAGHGVGTAFRRTLYLSGRYGLEEIPFPSHRR